MEPPIERDPKDRFRSRMDDIHARRERARDAIRAPAGPGVEPRQARGLEAVVAEFAREPFKVPGTVISSIPSFINAIAGDDFKFNPQSGKIERQPQTAIQGADTIRDFGDQVTEFLTSAIPESAAVEDPVERFFTREVPQALGQGTSMMMLAFLSRGASLAAGSAMASEGLRGEAEALGATEAEQEEAGVFGLGIGVTELVPIMRAIDRFDKLGGGSLKRILVQAAMQGGEEAIQEFGQTLAEQVYADQTFDPERKAFDMLSAAAHGAGVGFVSGGLLGGAAQSVVETDRNRKLFMDEAIQTFGPDLGRPLTEDEAIKVTPQEFLKTKAVRRWFGKSVVGTEKGEPIPVVHGTIHEFQDRRFSKTGDVGYHFGTAQAARDRLKSFRVVDTVDGPKPRFHKVLLRIENPIILPGDLGGWGTHEWLEFVKAYTEFRQGATPKDFKDLATHRQFDKYEELMPTHIKQKLHTVEDLAALRVAIEDRLDQAEEEKRIRSLTRDELAEVLFDQLGYDGVVYVNENEDPGSLSYIVPRGSEDQITPTLDSPEPLRPAKPLEQFVAMGFDPLGAFKKMVGKMKGEEEVETDPEAKQETPEEAFARLSEQIRRQQTGETPPEDLDATKPQTKVGGFLESLRKDPDISITLEDYQYNTRSNEEADANARQLIEQFGLPAVGQMVMNPNNELKPADRITTGIRLIKEYNAIYNQLKKERPHQARQVLEQTLEIERFLAEQATHHGQSLEAFAHLKDVTPEARIIEFEKLLQQGAKEKQKQESKFVGELEGAFSVGIARAADEALGRPAAQPIVEALQNADRAKLQQFGIQDTETVLNAFFGAVEKNVNEVMRQRFGDDFVGDDGPAAQGFRFRPGGFGRADMMQYVLDKMKAAGNFSAATRRQAISDYYSRKLSGATAQQKQKILDLSQDALAAPEGSFIASIKMLRLRAYMAEQAGKLDAIGLASSFWYSSLLSSTGTQAVNAFGTAANLLSQMVTLPFALGRKNAWAVSEFYKAMGRGAKAGAVEAFDVFFKAGITSPRFQRKFDAPSILDLYLSREGWSVKKAVAAAINLPFAGLKAVDAFFYRTAYEGRAGLLSALYAAERAGGRKQPNFRTFLAMNMMSTNVHQAAAEAQAKRELAGSGFDPNKDKVALRRRTYEILDAQRDTILRKDATRFAELTTFTNTPEGSFGALAEAMNLAIQGTSLPIRFKIPGTNKQIDSSIEPGRYTVLPFVRVVANVANRWLDFTPIGILRGMRGRPVTEPIRNAVAAKLGIPKKDTMFSPLEAKEHMAAGFIGTLSTTLLYAIASAFDEDDDPLFDITARGPRDFRHRNQLRSQGWKPYSFKVGEKYFAFNELPFAAPLIWIGAIQDAKRYDGLTDQEAVEQSAFIARLLPGMLVESSYLRGVADLLQALDGRKKWGTFFGSPVRGLVPFSGLLDDIADITNPVLRDSNTHGVVGNMMKNIPVARRMVGKPLLNVLGEPVELSYEERTPLLKRFMAGSTDDPVWRFLAKNKLFIPDPRDTGDISVVVPGLNKIERMFEKSAQGRRELEVTEAEMVAGVLTEDEAYEYVQISGRLLKEKLRDGIIGGTFTGMSRDEIEKAVMTYTREARREAKMEMLGIREVPTKQRIKNKALRGF